MLVAYLTLDEVNQDLAVGLAQHCNVTVDPVSFRDVPLARPFEALAYDLDSFPAAERDAVLTKLLSTLALDPVAVHSYKLEESQVNRLRQHGIAVHRRLGKAVFLGLKRRRGEAGKLRRAGA